MSSMALLMGFGASSRFAMRAGARTTALHMNRPLARASVRSDMRVPSHLRGSAHWFSSEANTEDGETANAANEDGEDVEDIPTPREAIKVQKNQWIYDNHPDFVPLTITKEDVLPKEVTSLVEMDDRVIQDLVDSGEDWESADEADPSPSLADLKRRIDPDETDSDLDHGMDLSDDGEQLFTGGQENVELGDEWIYDHKNHAYFNTETKEMLVRKAESNKGYEKRRSQRSLSRLEDLDQTPLKAFENRTAFQAHPEYIEASNLYEAGQMAHVRQKYNWMDYKALGKSLAEADTRFFQKSEHKNVIPWEPDVPHPIPETDQQDRHIEERTKMLTKLPHKFHVAQYRRVNMSRTGRVFTFGVLVLCGNGRGWAAYGYGKGQTIRDAERRAIDAMRKNLMDVPLLEGRTIFNTVVGRHGRTKVLMKRMPRGTGIRAGRFMMALTECLGISDLSTKVIGKRNPLHVAYAAFEGLSRIVSTREMALIRGVNYYKMFEAGTEHEAPPTQQEIKQQAGTIMQHIQQAGHLAGQRTTDYEKLKEWGKHKQLGNRHKDRHGLGWNVPYAGPNSPSGAELVSKREMQPKWIPPPQ